MDSWGDSAVTSPGYYNFYHSFDLKAANILYTDFNTHQQIYLCNDPACTHNDENCTSWFDDTTGGLYLFSSPDGKNIYYLCVGQEEPDNHEVDPSPRIYAMDSDGGNRRVLTRIEGAGRLVDAIAADSKYLCFDVNRVESGTARPSIALLRADCETGSNIS